VVEHVENTSVCLGTTEVNHVGFISTRNPVRI
jgi:hypothetical protein